jgi:hypothetical protein
MADTADLHRAVGRIEGKLDTFIAQMEAQDNRATNVEVRLRKVEARQHWYAGAGTVIGAIFAYFTKAHVAG